MALFGVRQQWSYAARCSRQTGILHNRLTSSFGGVDANIGIEFAFGRKTFSWDIWRFHHDGFILAETEFESPLKDWME